MKKRRLFDEYKLNEHYCGDAFEITISDIDTSTEKLRIVLLDKVCQKENLNQLGENWVKIDFTTANKILQYALRYDLAYSIELAPDEKAQTFKNLLLIGFEIEDCICYTNWSGLPGEENCLGWKPLTENTFDIAIVVMNQNKMVVTYFIAED